MISSGGQARVLENAVAIRGKGLKNTQRPRIAPRPLSIQSLVSYERVTVYTPQAVNSIVTVTVWLFRTTTAVILPASNRGAAVQLAL